MIKFLKTIFPPKAFGLHINDQWCQAMEIDQFLNRPKIKSVEHHPLPAGLIKNGEIIDEILFAAEVKKLLEKCKPKAVSRKKCIIAIPESQSYEQIFYIPIETPKKELKTRLDQMVSESIPLPFHQIKYDYHLTKKDKFYVAFVVAVKKEILAQYYDVLNHHCNIKPLIAEPESISLLRNIPLKSEQQNNTLVLDIKEDKIISFSFWEKIVVDSNILSKELLNTNSAQFISAIESSLDLFKELTGSAITQILISGPLDQAQQLQEALKTKVDIHNLHLIDKYRLEIKVSNIRYANEFKVVAGLALRGIGISIEPDINLLKRQ